MLTQGRPRQGQAAGQVRVGQGLRRQRADPAGQGGEFGLGEITDNGFGLDEFLQSLLRRQGLSVGGAAGLIAREEQQP